MTEWLKRLIGLSPWSRIHREAFVKGYLTGFDAGVQVATQSMNHELAMRGISLEMRPKEERVH
jgi:hypothetical protein